MKSFVLIYERPTGRLEIEVYDQGLEQEAFARRSLLQRTVGPLTEVVVLQGESVEDLRTTHRRYFESVEELAARFAS